ncbi:hypothetical protein F5146DRAFT_1146077 [Armillaria mellea]|nr:hypothetical protein F5146DRAFT_1146077 [Armillaria mellea]
MAPNNDLDPFQLQDEMDFNNLGQDYDPAQLHNAPDDCYEEVIMPSCCDFGYNDPFNDDMAPVVPPAFIHGEMTAVHLAYLQTIYNNVFCKIPVSTVTDKLNMTLNALDAVKYHCFRAFIAWLGARASENW